MGPRLDGRGDLGNVVKYVARAGLQWGRGSMAAEITTATPAPAPAPAPVAAASMGPRLAGRGDFHADCNRRYRRHASIEGAKDDRPKEWLHSHEIKPFLAFCSATFYPKAYAAIFLGLRRGEVIVCQWGDFDFDHGVVVVRNKPEFGFRTKYGRSRSIPLWPEVKEYFMRRCVEMGEPGPQGLVFPTVSGDRYCLNTMSFAHSTAETVKRAGITRPVTKFHDLRRTFGFRKASRHPRRNWQQYPCGDTADCPSGTTRSPLDHDPTPGVVKLFLSDF